MPEKHPSCPYTSSLIYAINKVRAVFHESMHVLMYMINININEFDNSKVLFLFIFEVITKIYT